MDYTDKIKLGFGVIAPVYDGFDLAFRLDPGRNPREALVRKIPNDPLRVLDVCVGTANTSLLIARANPLNRIVGIDLSTRMLAVAHKKIERLGIANIELLEMNAEAMAFPDGAFDVTTVSYGLHEMPPAVVPRVLAEIGRVTRRGGRLLIIDHEIEGGRMRRAAFSAFLKIIEPAHIPEFLRYDWKALLESAGFELEDVEIHFCSKLITATRTEVTPRAPSSFRL